MSDVSIAVLETVAEKEGVDPSALGVPLYEAVDTDALEAVSRRGDVRVTFEYLGYEVTVEGEKTVRATPVVGDG